MEWFNELTDLSAVAAISGLVGGAGGTGLVAMFVTGAVIKFVLRTVLTAILTGVGFYFMLDFLGFQIISKEEVASTAPIERSFGDVQPSFSPAGVGKSSPLQEKIQKAEADGDRVIVVRSPFRRGS
jgi:hypothetical protein